MKILIPRGKKNFELTENTISTKYLNGSKIIVIDGQDSAIGLLTKLPSRQGWFVTDLLMAQNFWDTIEPTPQEVLEIFAGPGWQIIQFDTKLEFLEWITKRLSKKISCSWSEA